MVTGHFQRGCSSGQMVHRNTLLAKHLRKNMTSHEVRRWIALKRLKPRGFKFRRQVPLGRYVVDFACFAPMLVIEVDGGQHTRPDHERHDRDRDAWLRGQGFWVHRIWNYQIDQEFDAVMHAIDSLLSLDGKGAREAGG